MSFNVKAQSITGIPGYIRIPTARFYKDGNLFFGTSFLPKNYLSYTKYNNDAITYYAGLTFLPFLEINFRLTRQLNLPDNCNHTADRMPSIRLRIINEKKFIPSIVIGVHDFISSLEKGVAKHFGATYIVVTKSFCLERVSLNLETSIGYGTDWLNSANNEFVGIFGGFAVNWNKISWITLMFDYDGEIPNAGLKLVCFKHLHLMAGLLNFNSLTGSISYHIKLKHN